MTPAPQQQTTKGTAFPTHQPFNEGVPGYPQFLPLTTPPVGTLLVEANASQGGVEGIQTFEPLTIRGMTFKNRIWASPMCQYSASAADGCMTDWHLVHLGALASRGVGALIVEASAILPEGRISPEDLGLWSDDQIAPAKRVVDFVRAQGTRIGVQLGHAGRKASTAAPWVPTTAAAGGSRVVSKEHGGWPDDLWAPSALPFAETYGQPKEATVAYLTTVVQAFVDAVGRAKRIGFDFIEIHGAHGYLLHSFCSPLSNVRLDAYGGPFSNRIRFPLEVTRAVRQAWGADKPLFYRLSASDWAPPDGRERDEETGEWRSWGIEQSILLAKALQEAGVDLIDTSSGGATIDQKIPVGPGYQLPFAAAIKTAVPSVLVGAVGLLTSAEQIESALRQGQADVALVARELLRNADFVLDCAERLGVVVKAANQYDRAWTRMAEARHAGESAFRLPPSHQQQQQQQH